MKKQVFSETELRVISFLGFRTKITVSEIAKKFYKKSEAPLYPNNNITCIITRIKKKCRYYDLNWTVEGEGLGRQGKTVWMKTI